MIFAVFALLWLGILTCASTLFWLRLLHASNPPTTVGIAWPKVLVALPLSTADNADPLAKSLERTLVAHTLRAYPGPKSLLFLASIHEPEAQARAQRHVTALRQLGVDAAWQSTHPLGLNRKAAQLAEIDPARFQDAVLVTVDSDVVLHTVALKPLVARLRAVDRPGAVWMATAPHGEICTLGDRVSQAVLAASGHAFAFIATLNQRDAVGKVLALCPQALDAAGGFGPSILCVGDDVSISRRLAVAGYTTRAVATPAASTCRSGESLISVWRRFVRWIHIMLAHRPQHTLSYPLFLFPLPLLQGLWALAAHNGVSALAATAGAVISLALRAWQARLCRLASNHPASWNTAVVDVVLAELFLAAALLSAPWVRQLRWHGRVLKAA